MFFSVIISRKMWNFISFKDAQDNTFKYFINSKFKC